MTKRKGKYSHYELMFENYLRKNNLLYIAINEAKRPLYKGERIKNFDFIVISKNGSIVLIDIKGKQFPYTSKYGDNYWENWVRLDDGKYLRMWGGIFRKGTKAILVFPYLIKRKEDLNQFRDTFSFGRKQYGLVAIEIEKYLDNSKSRSKSGEGTFNAISVSRSLFPSLVKPLSYYLK